MAADFQRALETFQSVSRRSAERQRLFVERAKASVDAAEDRGASCVLGSEVLVESLFVLIHISWFFSQSGRCRFVWSAT